MSKGMNEYYKVTWQSADAGAEECENAWSGTLREGIESFASFASAGAGCRRCGVRGTTGTLRLRAPDGSLLAERAGS